MSTLHTTLEAEDAKLNIYSFATTKKVIIKPLSKDLRKTVVDLLQ